MKKLHNYFVLMSIFSMIIWISCDNKEDYFGEDTKTDGRVIGSIHGVVTDESSNTRLDSVSVYWSGNGKLKSTQTNSVGYYAIAGLSPGNFELTFSKEGKFATGMVTVTIPSLQNIGITDFSTDEDFFYNEIQDIELYGLTADLTGIVYKIEDVENITVANGVSVIADFANYGISPDEYSSETDITGTFTFTNLPATSNVSLRTLPFNDGSNDYSVETSTASLVPNGMTNAGNIILDIATAMPFIVQNNYENDDFILTDDIVITFSKLMNTNSFDIDLWSNTYGNVGFEATWSNNITLTIDPYVALQANETYYIPLSGVSQDNNSFSDSLDFETQEGIKFIWTNLERVDGVFDEFSATSNIEIIFTMAVNLNNYNGYVTLYDEANTLVSTSLSTTDSTTLIIDPLYNLEPGQDYTLEWKVYSTIEGDYDGDEQSFETTSDVTVPAQVTGFAVDMGDDWKADWNTTSITFKWNTVGNADGYRIYAKDNGDNTDLVQVASLSTQDYMTVQSGTVDLNSNPQFDYYGDDGIQTPFTNGTELTFDIFAYNDAGEGTSSDALVVKDETAPIISISQDGSADNTTGENAGFVVDLDNQIEYCSPTNNPTFIFVEHGGDPDFVPPPSALVWVWDSDLRDGQATVIVPDGKNGAGDMLIATVTDNSGNTSASKTLYLTPIISFGSPTANTTWEAPSASIHWSINNTGVSPGISSVDVLLSIDGGASWIDTLTEGTSSIFYGWTIPDTLISDAQAVIGITDAESGGYIWKSSLFTISGIRVTHPTAVDVVQDSVAMDITWDDAGIDAVLIEHSYNGSNWTTIDTLSNTGSYVWTPQLGITDPDYYKIRVSDFDADYKPQDESDWFTIIPK